MKLCWNNLEGLSLSREGNFKYKNTIYVLSEDSCKICGDMFLFPKYRPTEFCSKGCSITNNPIIYNKGRTLSISLKAALSKGQLRRFSNKENHPRWKGGVSISKIPLYDTYKDQLINSDVSCIIINGLKVMQVKCVYCGKWFVPNQTQVRSRLAAIKCDPRGRTFGEGKLYCSEYCKNACPTFGRHKFPKGFKLSTSREVQPDLRKLVLERDNWACQKCGEIEVELHCHHVTGVMQNPIESADMDNCITLCKECHKEVHKTEGCKYYELMCNQEEIV